MSDCGGYWLGYPGHLLRVDGSHGRLVRSSRSAATVHDGGVAPDFAQVGTRRRGRVWQITMEHSMVREVAALHELMALQTLTGAAVMLVEPWAQVTNVLTPEASMVAASDLPRVGGFDLAGGGHVSSAAHNPDVTSDPNVARVWAGAGPVLPGRTVTASLWLASAQPAYVQVMFVDADNYPISWHDGPVVTGVDRLRRSVVTAQAPANAVAAWVLGIRATYLARAALTWTDVATEWGIGGLAQQAVLVEDVTDDVAWAVPGPDESKRREHASFVVREVGV